MAIYTTLWTHIFLVGCSIIEKLYDLGEVADKIYWMSGSDIYAEFSSVFLYGPKWSPHLFIRSFTVRERYFTYSSHFVNFPVHLEFWTFLGIRTMGPITIHILWWNLTWRWTVSFLVTGHANWLRYTALLNISEPLILETLVEEKCIFWPIWRYAKFSKNHVFG